VEVIVIVKVTVVTVEATVEAIVGAEVEVQLDQGVGVVVTVKVMRHPAARRDWRVLTRT
jgi:hypothetical protein